jgi:membrane-associated protease RseP (regulator of RpoE activity)
METSELPTSRLEARSADDHDVLMLRARVAEVMTIEQTAELAAGQVIAFTGKLRIGAQEAFERLKQRFAELGYMPAMRENDSGQGEQVMAIKNTLQANIAQRPWINILLLLATIVTTTVFGGMYAALLTGAELALSEILARGVPFALTLLSILAVHELGHYVQARRHGVPVTLPYFIPVPLPGTLGTFGAFIQMRGTVENKRALFDVGVGGPIAGLLVAVPLFVAGLLDAVLSADPPPPTRSYIRCCWRRASAW